MSLVAMLKSELEKTLLERDRALERIELLRAALSTIQRFSRNDTAASVSSRALSEDEQEE